MVSLTSADPVRRRELMPLERAYPLSQLMEAIREFHDASGERVVLAWTMISGINTREEDAIQLAELVRSLPIRLDLIDVSAYPPASWIIQILAPARNRRISIGGL